jgi:hypothetical protein
MNEKAKEDLIERLVNLELKIAGHDLTIDDVRGKENWFSDLTITEKQAEKFKELAIKDIAKTMKVKKTGKMSAESYFSWFDLSYGLRVV